MGSKAENHAAIRDGMNALKRGDKEGFKKAAERMDEKTLKAIVQQSVQRRGGRS